VTGGNLVRPVWAEVDLGALRHNYRELVGIVGPEVKVIASVKANAYGHGAVPVARTLADEGVFAVATGSFDDAVAIREAGVRTRILLFSGFLTDAVPELLRHDLIPTVTTLETAEAVSRAAQALTPVYVKVDSGLGRLGVPIEDAEGFVRAVAALPQVVVEGLYTHLPFLDAAGREWAAERLPLFRGLVEKLAGSGWPIPVTQALGSAGVLAGLPMGGDTAICPGHALYGIPAASAEVADQSSLRPVLRAVKTRLIHVVEHPTDRVAGIGGTRRLAAGAVTGVAAFGRYDGYRLGPDGEEAMLVGGRRVPVFGLSLEHTTLDLYGVQGAAVGDEVVVLGEQDGERIALPELAAWRGASPDDVLLGFERRMPCRYIDTEATDEAQPGAAAA
jgi:alanine racemase